MNIDKTLNAIVDQCKKEFPVVVGELEVAETGRQEEIDEGIIFPHKSREIKIQCSGKVIEFLISVSEKVIVLQSSVWDLGGEELGFSMPWTFPFYRESKHRSVNKACAWIKSVFHKFVLKVGELED